MKEGEYRYSDSDSELLEEDDYDDYGYGTGEYDSIYGSD